YRLRSPPSCTLFLFIDLPPTAIYPLSLHDALPILRHFGAEGLRGHLAEHMRLARLFADWVDGSDRFERVAPVPFSVVCFRLRGRSEEHTSELQSHLNLVCRLLLEKKKTKKTIRQLS